MKTTRLLGLLFLLVAPAWSATKLWMHEVTSPMPPYRYATTTIGQGTSQSITNSVAGPTNGVQLTKTAGGPVVVWISPPLAAAATISGTVTMNAYAKASATACNCGLLVTAQKYSRGAEEGAFLTTANGTALGTTLTLQTWTATPPTSTSFAPGDRIVVKWWIKDAGGTMASGNTVTMNYDGHVAGQSTDNVWVQFNETLSFQPEPEIIQNKRATVNTSTVNVTLNSTGAGHLLAVLVTTDHPSTGVSSISDNATGGSCNYVEANALNVDPVSGGGFSDIWYCANSNAGATNLAVTITPATGGELNAWVYEVSGLDTNSPLDVSGKASDPNTDSIYDGVALTTTGLDFLAEANDISCDNITSVSAPWTLDMHPGGDAAIYLTGNGSYQPTFTACAGATVMSGAAFRQASPNQAPTVDAGPNQTATQTLPTTNVTLEGSATDDGLPNPPGALTISWSKVSGPGTVTFTSPSTATTSATFSTFGTYVLQLTANDSQLSSSSNVTVTVNPSPISLSLTPLAAGPNVKGTTQTMSALLKNGTGPTSTPISGVSVSFTVTGPNATTGNSTTDATGTANFTYTGANSGTDTVTASYTAQNSNSANVSWLVPSEPISTGPVLAQFFSSNGSSPFNTPPSATPVFTQRFPNIGFNPLGGSIPGNTSGVGPNSRPFTDVTTDANGNFTGTIVAQGNGLQAGVGNLFQFQAAFTGSFTIAAAGQQTITMAVDDCYFLFIGGGATHVSGPMTNVPPSGLAPYTNTNVAVVGGGCWPDGSPHTQVINFPTAGVYSYELDYSECCSGPLYMSMTLGSTNSIGFPPTGSLSLSPITPSSLSTGQTQSFTAQVIDASGAPLQNATVALVVNGANLRQLTATTDSTGHATLQYTGTNAGSDTVQATANISGVGEYSNQVKMTWTVAGGSGATTFVPQGWIGSPTVGTVVQGQVPITVASGVTLTSGILSYWPTSSPAAVTTLNSNTTGSGTLATFDATVLASGGYTIQLNATANGTTQVSQITVTVVGNNKPGRMTSTVTEFKVPLAGIPISITRTYDSLDKSKIEDFGFGWKLGTFVDLSVDAQNNVTFNFNGQKITFFFTPQPQFFFGIWLTPHYTPQAGVHGSLASDGCGGLIRLQTGLVCFPSTGQTYQPTVYAYTDPIGRVYTMTASGQLLSIQDLNGNMLTIAQNGITSSVNGVVVPFVRDGSGRITQITDLEGNNYTYTYDSSGNLQSVQYPGLTRAETYSYATDHSMLTETDPRGNQSTATYFDSTNDGGNKLLDGRLKSITDTTGVNTWNYSYNLSTNATTTTNPDGGTVTRTDDNFGKPLSMVEQVNTSTSRTTTYQYDANENLVKVIRPCGNASCSDTTGNDTYIYGYDANGFQTSIQDPLGHTSHKTYNSFGGVLTAIDAASSNTQTTTYDGNFNPIQVTDLLNGAGSPVSSSTYDGLGNLLTSTDANGKTTQYAYDPTGNLIQVTDALAETTNYAYDPMNRLVSQTDPLRNTTQFTYDPLGRLLTKTDALHDQIHYTYDNNGNKASETDALGNVTTYAYDNMNRVSTITYPTSPATTKQFTYDFRGNKLTEVDQSGRTTKYVYDLAGQLISKTYAFGTADAGTVQYSYDLDGRLQTTTDELNNVTTNTYDAAGNLATVKDALTNVTTNGYDADNRKTSVKDANQNTTSYAYDARSRLKTVTYPIVPPANQATTTQYTYDGMGRVLTTTDQAGNVTTKTYDDVGRLSTVKDAILPTGNVTQYFYDLNGNLKKLTDANGHNTTYQYDTLNRRSMRTLPLAQSETTTYDAVGNLLTKTDFNGKSTSYEYDTINRLKKKIPDPSLSQTTISFTYNPTNTRATMVDASGTTTYSSYDNRDRLKTVATPEGTLNYTYDAHGNLLTIASSNTNGASLTYTYDVLNRLATVTDNRMAALGGPSGQTTYAYDAVSNLQSYTYPNTVQTANVFDPLNRLTQTCAATSTPACTAGTKLASYAYTLGNAGNRTNVLELSNRNVAYGYDNDYRLTSEAITADPVGNNGTVSYTQYDAVGNRQAMTSTLSAVPNGSFSYDNNDRYALDTFDNNGNTISSAGISNTYDFENRMLTHGAVTLVYDGDGNRVSETVGGTTTKYLVGSLNPTGLPQVLDEKVSATVTRIYAYGLQRISAEQKVGSTWTPSFYGYDGHGNVRFLMSKTGTITDSYDYDAFGMPVRTSGTTANPFLYSGERSDNSIGLYDLRARYYNQATGRFWSMDLYPGQRSRPSTLHKYTYTANNPINYIDPRGLGEVETFALWQKVTAWTVLVALPLGETLEWAFGCEGHEAASAVPTGTPLPPQNWLPPSGPTIGPPPPPTASNAGPCTIPRPHLGPPAQGPRSPGSPSWPDPRPGGEPLGPASGPGE